jgi:hypothetical protein
MFFYNISIAIGVFLVLNELSYSLLERYITYICVFESVISQ